MNNIRIWSRSDSLHGRVWIWACNNNHEQYGDKWFTMGGSDLSYDWCRWQVNEHWDQWHCGE